MAGGKAISKLRGVVRIMHVHISAKAGMMMMITRRILIADGVSRSGERVPMKQLLLPCSVVPQRPLRNARELNT